MCLVVAFIATIYALTAFNAGHTASAWTAALIALFFAALLARNIVKTQQNRKEKNRPPMKEKP